MEPEEEGDRDEEEDAAPAMERAEAGVSVGSPGAPGPEEPGSLPWCKRGGRGGRTPGAGAAAVGVRPSPPRLVSFVFLALQ